MQTELKNQKAIQLHKNSSLLQDFNVLDTQPSEALQLNGVTSQGHVLLWLVFANVFISTLLVVVLSLCFSQRKMYTRQLRAASVHSYGESA